MPARPPRASTPKSCGSKFFAMMFAEQNDMRCNDVPAAPEMMCRLRGNTAEKLFELEQSRAACGLPDFVFSQVGSKRVCTLAENKLSLVHIRSPHCREAAHHLLCKHHCAAHHFAQQISFTKTVPAGCGYPLQNPAAAGQGVLRPGRRWGSPCSFSRSPPPPCRCPA